MIGVAVSSLSSSALSVRGSATVAAFSAVELVAIWKMKATSSTVIMSIIGMMLRCRIDSPSGTRPTALRMMLRASRCVKPMTSAIARSAS